MEQNKKRPHLQRRHNFLNTLKQQRKLTRKAITSFPFILTSLNFFVLNYTMLSNYHTDYRTIYPVIEDGSPPPLLLEECCCCCCGFWRWWRSNTSSSFCRMSKTILSFSSLLRSFSNLAFSMSLSFLLLNFTHLSLCFSSSNASYW